MEPTNARGAAAVEVTPETQTYSSRMSIPEIASRLDIGRLAVYAMLEQGLLPGIRLGRRWIVTRYAFESWEQTCGMRDAKGRADEMQTPQLTRAGTLDHARSPG